VVNTGKYVQQLQYLLSQNDETALHSRLEKGCSYYNDFLGNHIAALLLHMQQMQWRSGVKTYLNTLAEVDQLLMKKYEDIAKALLIIQGLLKQDQFIDVSVIDRQRETLRLRWLEQAKEQAKQSRPSTSSGEAVSSPKKRGRKNRSAASVAKSKGKDTVSLTVELFLAGKTVAEVGKERSLAQSTIEGHLAKAIGTGKLPLNNYVPSQDAAIIEACIAEHGTSGLKPVHEALGNEYTWGMIKAVAASLRGMDNADAD